MNNESNENKNNGNTFAEVYGMRNRNAYPATKKHEKKRNARKAYVLPRMQERNITCGI